jgi:HEAT repeat protein
LKPASTTTTSQSLIDGKPLSAWVEELGNPDVSASRNALKIISENSTEAKPLLVTVMQNPGAKTSFRLAVIDALGRTSSNGDPEVDLLFATLKDKNTEVRYAAIKALHKCGPTPEVLVPLLIKLTTDTNSGVRRTGVQFLGELGDAATSALPTLQTLTNDSEKWVREAAFESISRISPPRLNFSDSTLTAAMKDLGTSDPDAQERARDTIRKIGRAAVPELVALLENQQNGSKDRGLAAEALGYAGKNQEPEVPALTTAILDKNIVVRYKSLASLGMLKLDPKTLVPLCVARLKDRDGNVRRRAAEILGQHGAAAAEAVTLLQKISLDDKDAKVRSAAVSALKKIGGQGDP